MISLDAEDIGTRPKSGPKLAETSISQIFNDSETAEQTFALIKPDAMHPSVIEEIFEHIKRNRFDVIKKKKVWLSKVQVADAPTLAIILAKDDGVRAWRELIGPQNSKRAKEEFPRSIRALFGTDGLVNAVYGSDTLEIAEKDIELFFASSQIPDMQLTEEEMHATPGTSSGKTLALIKPDIIFAEKVEEILQKIIYRGFQVIKREELQLSEEQVVEMFAEYNNEAYFFDLLAFMTSTPIIVLALKAEDAARVWQEMMGPNDPEEAKKNFPQSIRAIYGTDIVKNAVYGSPTNDMAAKEIQFLFPNSLHRSSSQLYAMRSASKLNGSVTQLSVRTNLERTLAIIKPDVYSNTEKRVNLMAIIQNRGFKCVAESEMTLSDEKAKELYKEHMGQPFFDELITLMSSAPVYVLVLEKHSAIGSWREIIGPKNPQQALETSPD
ncbi:Thioredoxin domain-containing protein 3, partial [Nowakowskiella sp. JEL0078]